ncbi:hypothetical protein LJR258_001773 [Rhizobium sp. LjRoot258]
MFGIVFCLLSIAFSPAKAADFEAEHVVSERESAVIVSPYARAGFLKGNGSLSGFDTDVDVSFSNILDHLEFALMGNVKVTNGKWSAREA